MSTGKIGTIADKTVFLRVNFRVMGNSRKVANSAVLSTDADTKLLKVQKALLDSPELDAIRKADGEMRTFLYGKCLPYDMGIMLLPLGLLEMVNAELQSFSKNRELLVDAFIAAYPDRVKDALERLGSIGSEGDYLNAETVREKFSFDWQYITFMTPETLKLAGMYETEKAKAAAKLQEAADEITVLMRETLAELVNHLKVSLEPNADGKPKRLFSSAVTNIQEFLKTFEARNITGDKDLEKLAADVQKLITPELDVDVLRKDESFKAQIHSGMSALGTQLTALVEEIPGRRFRASE